MLSEMIKTLFDNAAARTAMIRTGDRVDLGGPKHIRHYIDRDGSVVEHAAPPDYVDLNLGTIDGVVDYLVGIADTAAADGEIVDDGRGFSIDDVDVFVREPGIVCSLDRNTDRDRIRCHFTKTHAAQAIDRVGRIDDDNAAAQGAKLRQTDVVRFLDLDLRGFVDPGIVKKFEKISWMGGETATQSAMRDRASLGHEIEATAKSIGSGSDPSELPDFIDVVFPWFNDPIFQVPERYSRVRMFVFPDLQTKTIELAIRPDELITAQQSAVQHAITFMRENIEKRTGSKFCRIVGG